MGQHFDSLVELVKHHLTPQDHGFQFPCVQQYLQSVIRRAALFELPIDCDEVFPHVEKSKEEYAAYIRDYYALSAAHGRFLAFPFPVTMIEDPIRVVLLEPLKNHPPGAYVLTTAQSGVYDGASWTVADTGFVQLGVPGPGIHIAEMKTHPSFTIGVRNGARVMHEPGFSYESWGELDEMQNKFMHYAAGYLEELVYIMDPDNFIIEREHAMSIGERRKEERKQKSRTQPLQKTIVRPHYICVAQDELSEFFEGKSSEPRLIHPVRGHWKRLMSDKFKHKQGQTIFIRQHYRGTGIIHGDDHWTYRVFVKESVTSIAPYQS